MFRRLSGRARRPPGKRTAPPSRHPRKTQLRFECLEERALLATFTVSALGDSPVLAPGDAPGTLRQAIFDANNSVGADVINFAPALSGTIELTAGELLITGALTIEGPGATQLTIDASTSDPTPGLNNGDGIRVFHIDDSSPAVNSPVTISGLTITGGDVNGAGGGIRSLENLALEGVVVTGNASTDNGAGVFISTAGGLNSVVRSTISGNIAPTPDDLGAGCTLSRRRVVFRSSRARSPEIAVSSVVASSHVP